MTGYPAATAGNPDTFKLVEYLSFRRLPSQLPELDGLRGLAIILVLLRHAVRPFWTADEPIFEFLGYDIGIFMVNGWIGVDLFFVLSGFLITHHILRLAERNAGIWTWGPYLRKRALRIVPAYYTVLTLTVIGVFPHFEFSLQLMGPRVAYHLLFLQDYLPANIVVAFWSLGVEEKFYLLAPLLIFARANAGSRGDRMRLVALLLCLGITLRFLTAVSDPDVVSYEDFFYTFRSPFHMTLDPILIGVLIAFIYRARSDYPRLTGRVAASIAFWIGAVIFICISTSGAMMDRISWWDKTLQPTAIAIAFGGMTFGLLFGAGPRRIFRSLLLFFFARISYSLYLVHLPLVPVSMLLAREIAPAQGQFLVFIAFFGALSLAAALVLHFTVEKPFLILKDRVS